MISVLKIVALAMLGVVFWAYQSGHPFIAGCVAGLMLYVTEYVGRLKERREREAVSQ